MTVVTLDWKHEYFRFRESNNFAPLRGVCAVGKRLGDTELLPLDASHVCGHFDSFHADMKFSCKMGGGKIEKFDLVKKHNSSGPVRIFGIRDL